MCGTTLLIQSGETSQAEIVNFVVENIVTRASGEGALVSSFYYWYLQCMYLAFISFGNIQ